MFDRMINFVLITIVLLTFNNLVEYKGPQNVILDDHQHYAVADSKGALIASFPVLYDNQIIILPNGEAIACPTAQELNEFPWSCGTDTECNDQYVAAFGFHPSDCGDEA